MPSAWHNMILLNAIRLNFNNAIHNIYEGANKYAFTVLGTFIYIATSFCEAALLLFPKSIIDGIEENLRT